ncbi:DUF6163 family protein [Methyloraptor flagellatus]|jgi:uncharacterized membrane protein|uniref:DUF6163 family protein n=1 Tax=Methyloraptor flagellatus TaxID=3162530 RepID=A0AAU7XFS1_9HYPH
MSDTSKTDGESEGRRFGFRLVLDIYTRLVAVVLLGYGLWAWASVIGATPDGIAPFLGLNAHQRAEVVFTAIVDPVAATGMWIGSPWGAVIWFFANLARVIVHTGFAHFFGWTTVTTGIQIGSILVYVVLVFLAEREDRIREAKRRSRRGTT